MASEKYTLNKTDLEKIFNGALVALSGALLTYVSQVVVQVDFGVYSPLVVSVWSVVVNVVRKYFEGR